MVKTKLVEDLQAFIEHSLENFILPVKPRKGDEEPVFRAPIVFKQRVPDSESATSKAPCALVQLTDGSDLQNAGDKLTSTATVRLVFMVYCEDEQEGAMNLLEVMERVRIDLLEMVFLNNQFMLDTTVGIETTIYNDNTAPFYIGEMVTTWQVPPVKRKVTFYGEEKFITGRS